MRQHPVKMAHLLTGSCSSCHVCVKVSHLLAAPSQDGTSFDWFMFVMSHVFVKVSHLSAAPSQDVTSFDWFMFVMSHVFVKVSPTFWQNPVKMAHLLTGSCSSCHMRLSRCPTFRQHPVKMAHLLTGSCSSCHMRLSRCPTFRQHPVKMAHLLTGSCSSCHVFVKVSHLSAAHSQDGTSFDWFMFIMSHACVYQPFGTTHTSLTCLCVCEGVSPFSSTWRAHLFSYITSIS